MQRSLLILLMLAACGHAEEFGADRPPPSDLVGNACDNNGDCEQLCAGGSRFPGGFCTLRCSDNADCPGGTVCITRDEGVCVYPCARPVDCTSEFLGRAGYVCEFQPGFDTDDATQVRYQVCIGS